MIEDLLGNVKIGFIETAPKQAVNKIRQSWQRESKSD